MAHTQWNSLMQGVIGQECRGDGCMPLRFTPAQMAVYADDPGYHACSQASSGMCLDCETDAEELILEGDAFRGSTRDIWSFDLLVDRRLFAHREGSIAQEPHMSWRVKLPKGRKHVQLYFPCLASVSISRLEWLGGTETLPVVPQKRLLCLGDSITQGYTVHFPSLSYAARLAAALDMALLNQAIAGETFHAAMLDGALGFTPDLITVAYGTNDWSCKPRDMLVRDAEEYLDGVRRLWPRVPLVVIGPLWRGDQEQFPERFPFADLQPILASAAERHDARFVRGDELFPAVPELMQDAFLHPNDLGQALYGERLAAALKR